MRRDSARRFIVDRQTTIDEQDFIASCVKEFASFEEEAGDNLCLFTHGLFDLCSVADGVATQGTVFCLQEACPNTNSQVLACVLSTPSNLVDPSIPGFNGQEEDREVFIP